ncbi:MAG: sensor histidine kinase [Spirochaetota bacterium]
MTNRGEQIGTRIGNHLSADHRTAIREVRPLYIVVELVVIALYGASIAGSPGLWEPVPLAAFTTLMALHGILHWISPRLILTRPRRVAYFASQAVVVSAIILVAPGSEPSLTLGLCSAMTGEAIGMLRGKPGETALVVAAFVAVAALSLTIASEIQFTARGMLGFLALLFFVATYTTMFARQMEARERAQATLRDLEVANRRLAESARRIEELSIANERQRMARELHDTLTQDLSGLVLQLDAAESFLEQGRPIRARGVVTRAAERARSALADSRDVIRGLRHDVPPRTFPERDLEEAVHAESRRFTECSGIPCNLSVELLSPPSETIREHAHRAVAEGLSNIAKHAHARSARVRIIEQPDAITVVIQDDGIGFNAGAPELRSGSSNGGADNDHFGLIGLRERARLAGGTLAIQSAPGNGTTLQLSFPKEQTPDDA